MKATSALILSIVLVPAFVACQDRRNDTEKTTATRAQGSSDYNKDKDKDYTGTKPAPSAGETADKSGLNRTADKDKMGDTKLPGSSNELGAKAGADLGSSAQAKLMAKDSPSLTGTAKLHDVTMGAARLTIDLKGAKPGTYMVGIYDAGDCAAVAILDADNGNDTTAKSAGKNAAIGTAGEITVDNEGKGHLDSSITGIKGSNYGTIGSWDKKAVVIYSTAARADTTKSGSKDKAAVKNSDTTNRGQVACGLLSTSREPQTQG